MLITILFEVTCFFKLQNSIKTHFISIQDRQGGLYAGGGGVLIARYVFCLLIDGPTCITGGGAYKQKFPVQILLYVH